jgi:hypothetical protein
VYASTVAFDFPVGVANYTPGTIKINGAPAAYGSITVVPVNFAHPNVTAPGRSITYFWRTKSSGFNLTGATVTHTYTYALANVVTSVPLSVTTDGYVPARFNVPTSSWTSGTTAEVDEINRIIGDLVPSLIMLII